jgi:RNA polymerase sporulation-specific sigma factor
MTSLPHYEGYQTDVDTTEPVEVMHRPRLTLIEVESEDHLSPIADTGPLYEYLGDWRKAEAARKDADAFEALHEEYAEFIRFKASGYFLQGGDAQDLIQEATIGFYKGIRDYGGRKSSLRTFLDLCVSRQIITAVKTATRKKHNLLNQAVSFNSSLNNGDGIDPDLTIESLLVDKSTLPDDTVAGKEAFNGLLQMLTSALSPLESAALKFFIEGYTYEAIAQELAIDAKSIDNALQRVKRKIERYTEESYRPTSIRQVREETETYDLEQEQNQLDNLYENWLAHVYNPSGDNLCRILSELRTRPEARNALMREARGYIALIALDSDWRSPLKAYRVATSAVMQKAIQLSANEQSSESDVADALIDAALKAVQKN